MSLYTVTKQCHHYHLMSSYTSIHNIDWYFLSFYSILWTLFKFPIYFLVSEICPFSNVFHSVELLMRIESFQSCDLFINNSRPFNNNNKAEFLTVSKIKDKTIHFVIIFFFQRISLSTFQLTKCRVSHLQIYRSKIEAIQMGCLSRINATVLWWMESDPQNVIIHWNDLSFWTTSYEILIFLFFFDCRFLRMENGMN